MTPTAQKIQIVIDLPATDLTAMAELIKHDRSLTVKALATHAVRQFIASKVQRLRR